MSGLELFFYAAVAWFSFIILRIAVLIWRFLVFPRGYGRIENVSLAELSRIAEDRREDLPTFRIVVPAWQESLVIDGTLRRIAAQTYPRTHFEVSIVTYCDEPVPAGEESTYAVARRTADALNANAGRAFIEVLTVPPDFDGSFPGEFGAAERHIGKSRGLNFALRHIHLRNEREERALFLDRMDKSGHSDRVEAIVRALEADAASASAETLANLVAVLCDLAPCTRSRQLERLLACHATLAERTDIGDACLADLGDFIAEEAPRFFLEPAPREAGGVPPRLRVMPDRVFLHDAMLAVEQLSPAELAAIAGPLETHLATARPHLWRRIEAARDGHALYQLVRRIGTRWMAVYDADADPPVDLLRHLAVRSLEDPSVMGFQGPVSPVANYADVHPLCQLGGLWMGFWHTTGYPRLMSNARWAHVLAGTNWCLRIEGMVEGDALVNASVYDETKRRFLLSFDPQQLTEDLEVAVRVFSEWRVNAQWHPLVEFEQVPAEPRAMIVQRRRWTLGTLQTLPVILRGRLPLMQKLKYALLPLDIVFSGSGPIVTILLWILVYGADMLNNPVLLTWSIVLTFGNLVYVIPYLLAHERFVMTYRRAEGVDHLLTHGPALAEDLRERLDTEVTGEEEAREARAIAALLEMGRAPGGFLRRAAAERAVEPAGDEAPPALVAATPNRLDVDRFDDLSDRFGRLVARLSDHPPSTPDPKLAGSLAQLRNALEKAANRGPWRRRRRRERRRIWLWAFVYLFWQLIPYYGGLFVWLFGRRTREWVKTPRTRKTNAQLE